MRDFLSSLWGLVYKNKSLPYLVGLLILCYFFFFSNIGDYRLIDIDETRYINISHTMFENGNYITPYLNFEPFLEKPPLFYWLTVLSYKFFGIINSFTSRFPVALLGAIGVIATYFYVNFATKSKTSAFLSSIILMSSFWYALFAHIAILDMGFTVFVTLAFYFGTATLFTENKTAKNILWLLGYAFLGFSVLQKGLIGIIIPGAPLLISFLILKRAKEILKPSHIIPGIIVFLLIAAPWHYLVYKANGEIWFNDYIVKHHFARFADSSMGIKRKQSLLFYIPVILGGLLPWTLFFVSPIIKFFKNAFTQIKAKNINFLSENTNRKKLILIASISFITTLLFFSISSTKLPTYILPLFPAISILTGCFWHEYLKESKNKLYVEISAFFTLLLFLGAGIFGIFYYLIGGISIGIELAVSFAIFSIFGFVFLFTKQKIWLFSIFAAFSFSLFAVSGAKILNFVTSFGQNELEKYAYEIVEDKSEKELIAFGFSHKYSILNIYNKKPVYFIISSKNRFQELDDTLNKLNNKNTTIYLISKRSKLDNEHQLKNFRLIESGNKYDLYKKK